METFIAVLITAFSTSVATVIIIFSGLNSDCKDYGKAVRDQVTYTCEFKKP